MNYLLNGLTKTNLQQVSTHTCAKTISTIMNSASEYEQLLRKAFIVSVQSVKPKSLFRENDCMEIVSLPNALKTLKIADNNGSELIDIGRKQCHLVGFGKAVLGMAVEIEKFLGGQLQSGILSIPCGTIEKFKSNCDMQLMENSVIELCEGGENNLPDKAAEETARKIYRKMQAMNQDDIVFVCVSGGGSSLLPLPKDGVLLNEKTNIIKELASIGADISEINTVRTVLSRTKGGQLAMAAKNAHRVISFVISDIVGDPLHLIASGPTICYPSKIVPSEAAALILKQYDLYDCLDNRIKQAMQCNDEYLHNAKSSNLSTCLIGSNKIAIESARKCIKNEMPQCGIICLSDKVEGTVTELSDAYYGVAKSILKLRRKLIATEEFRVMLLKYYHLYKFSNEVISELINTVSNTNHLHPIAVIAGGEPTVKLTGQGIGGRNQELVLRVCSLLSQDTELQRVMFLSAGTDGIDGPTTAAGAIGNGHIIQEHISSKSERSIDSFLNENDSFSFFSNFENGRCHIVTGHTGTNVMDIHLMIVPNF